MEPGRLDTKWTLWTEVSILTGKKMYASKVECWRQNTPSFTLEALGRETAALSFVTSLRIAKPRHMPLFDFLRRGQSTQDAPQHLLRPTYLLKLIAVFFLYLIAGKLGLSMTLYQRERFPGVACFRHRTFGSASLGMVSGPALLRAPSW